ncbi:MAG: terminase small subunit [Oceanococcaceae bacterium]
MARPRKIKSAKEFDRLVDDYVTKCKEDGEPITWTGMALGIGLLSRNSIDEYATYPGFSHSVKRAKTFVENAYERNLHGASPAGSIFALKNMKWSDRRELSGPDGGPIPIGDAKSVLAEKIAAIREREGGGA